MLTRGDRMNLALRAKVGSAAAKAVLLVLADMEGNQGNAWPSHRFLAAVTELHQDTVRRSLRQLKAVNAVKVTHQTHASGAAKSNGYSIDWDTLAKLVPEDIRELWGGRSAQGARGAAPRGGGRSAQDGVGAAPRLEPEYRTKKRKRQQPKGAAACAGITSREAQAQAAADDGAARIARDVLASRVAALSDQEADALRVRTQQRLEARGPGAQAVLMCLMNRYAIHPSDDARKVQGWMGELMATMASENKGGERRKTKTGRAAIVWVAGRISDGSK